MTYSNYVAICGGISVSNYEVLTVLQTDISSLIDWQFSVNIYVDNNQRIITNFPPISRKLITDFTTTSMDKSHFENGN